MSREKRVQIYANMFMALGYTGFIEREAGRPERKIRQLPEWPYPALSK
jgi:hypothetical protein